MLKPSDIENITFGRSLRGYSYDEVDDFMDDIIVDYTKLYNENNRLKSELELLKNSLTEYNSMKETLQNSILFAQSASDDVVKEAEHKAANVIKTANDEVAKLKSSYDVLQMEVDRYKASIREMCNRLIDMIDAVK